MIKSLQLLSLLAAMLINGIASFACTSAIVAPTASKYGRPMLWKHRDSSFESNFVESVAATDSTFAYIALFNAGDSLKAEAWIGVNERGFAIMNTASYNLAPDTATYKDREGFLMTEALRYCSSVDDFSKLLAKMPRPLGVQANFGAIDLSGAEAYFETDDNSFTKYDITEATDGVMLRTNYSFSGDSASGFGYIRYASAATLLDPAIRTHQLTPAHFTETVSRSFYHSLTDRDALSDSCRWAVDQDFIPRHSSSASVVIELLPEGKSIMWTALGYPPCAIVYPATIAHIPECLRPTLPGYRAEAAETSLAEKRKAFPLTRGSGPKYIDLDYVRSVAAACHSQSMKNYEK